MEVNNDSRSLFLKNVVEETAVTTFQTEIETFFLPDFGRNMLSKLATVTVSKTYETYAWLASSIEILGS